MMFSKVTAVVILTVGIPAVALAQAAGDKAVKQVDKNAELEKSLRGTGSQNHTSTNKQVDRERAFVDPRDWSALMTQNSEWREENGRFRMMGDDRNPNVKHLTITYADGRTGRCIASIKGCVILFGGALSGTGGISLEEGKLVMTVIRKAEEGKPDERIRLVSPQTPPKPRMDGT